jgi:hypothetical protein
MNDLLEYNNGKCSVSSRQTPRHQGQGGISLRFGIFCWLSHGNNPPAFIFLDFLAISWRLSPFGPASHIHLLMSETMRIAEATA